MSARSFTKVNAAAGPASSGLSSRRASEPVSRRVLPPLQPGVRRFDPLAFARVFPDRWMAFLHAHFQNPVHVAFTFGVTEKAARKWWEGIGGPGGAKVAQAQVMYPAETQMLFAAE